jgi:adenylate cyclase
MKPRRSLLCKGCLQHMHMPVPLRGPLSIPMRVVGLRPSRMNPNLCTLCETMFKHIMKRRQIHVPLTILFADVRGYTTLSESMESHEMIAILSQFYELCGEAVWEQDGIVNKLIGDAVLSIFNFPIGQEGHVENAVLAAVALQERWASRTPQTGSEADPPVGVGVGIHTGTVAIGEVGEACRDFTAIGSVVNLASRLQGAAKPGEILVTEDVYQAVAPKFPNAARNDYQLKGLERTVAAWTLIEASA